MRQLLTLGGIGLVVAGCAGDGGTGLPPPAMRISATATANGNDQTGEVATALPLPLRVVVDSVGVEQEGVTVRWNASAGILAPAASVTDAAGMATTTWTLDSVVGLGLVTATLDGSPAKVTFRATARPGPAVSIKKESGDGQTACVNQADFPIALGVRVADRYGNAAPGPVTWRVGNGPVRFTEPPSGLADSGGFSSTRLRPRTTQGSALVEASLEGGAPAVTFNLTVGPPCRLVRLLMGGGFVSVRNGSRNPAVDTIPAGRAVLWMATFDYDAHRVVSVGSPSFTSPGDFPYALDYPQVSVTFTVPGSYAYADSYNPDLPGGIVVVQ